MNIPSVEFYAKLITFPLNDHRTPRCWYHYPPFQTWKQKAQNHGHFPKVNSWDKAKVGFEPSQPHAMRSPYVNWRFRDGHKAPGVNR